MEICKRVHANNLVRWAKDKPEVLVLSADLTSSCEADSFRDTYPDRFFSMGIAEQNMLGFAGGLARQLAPKGREQALVGLVCGLLLTLALLRPLAELQWTEPELAWDGPAQEALAEALKARRLVCAGSPVSGTGKLTAPAIPMKKLAALADYVLVEADGSAGRPFKAHAAHEPVLPRLANQVIYMVGASGFGRPVREAVHRPELFWFLSDLEPGDPVTPEAVAEALQIEAAVGGPPVRVFVNQAEDEAALANARRLAERLPWPVCAGALNRRSWTCLL